MFRCLVLFAVAALATTGAFATNGAYVGASAGQSNTEIEDSGATFDGSGTAFKLQGGYRVMKHFGVEADYRDFGARRTTAPTWPTGSAARTSWASSTCGSSSSSSTSRTRTT